MMGEKSKYLDAYLYLNDVKVQSGIKKLELDSTSLIATSTNGVDSIVLLAPFATIQNDLV